MIRIDALLFGAAVVAYFAGAVLFPANLFLKNPRLNGAGIAISLLGLLCHTLSMMVRSAQTGVLPLSSPGEGWSCLGWAILAIYLSLAVRPGLRGVGAFALPAALISLLVAAVSPARRPILEGISTWGLALHVSASILSIGMFAVAFACAVCYLIQDHLLKSKRIGGIMRSLPPLHVLDATSYWLVVFGFCLLTIGMVSGAILAQGSWLRLLDHPDTYATLVLWLTYGAYLYVRGVARWQGRRTHTAVVVAVVLLLAAYSGSLFLTRLTTLHSHPLLSSAEASPARVPTISDERIDGS